MHALTFLALTAVAVSFAAVFAQAQAHGQGEKDSRMNVLFFAVDDLRYQLNDAGPGVAGPGCGLKASLFFFFFFRYFFVFPGPIIIISGIYMCCLLLFCFCFFDLFSYNPLTRVVYL